jgi:glycosyltransferase involved in cell wall biosynthesis
MANDLSIIIPSLNEGSSLEKMVPNIRDTVGLNDYEIIVVNSGGTETAKIRRFPEVCVYDSPVRLGAPQARNFGANKASSDLLMFLDAHMTFFEEGWGYNLVKSLDTGRDSFLTTCIGLHDNIKVRAAGYQWQNLKMQLQWLPDAKPDVHEIPFAGAGCMLVEKKVFDKVGQFDSGIRYWGTADYELSLRAWLLGYRILCDPSVKVGHEFRDINGQRPWTIDPIDIIHNKIRLAVSHFNTERLSRYLREFSNICPDILAFNRGFLMAIEGGALDRRADLLRRRVNDDDWFFEKFPMNGWIDERKIIDGVLCHIRF